MIFQSFLFCFSRVWGFGSHLAVFLALHIEPLVGLRGPYAVPEIESRSAMCKANTLHAIKSLQPCFGDIGGYLSLCAGI